MAHLRARFWLPAVVALLSSRAKLTSTPTLGPSNNFATLAGLAESGLSVTQFIPLPTVEAAP